MVDVVFISLITLSLYLINGTLATMYCFHISNQQN